MTGKTKQPKKSIAKEVLDNAQGVMESFYDAGKMRPDSKQTDKQTPKTNTDKKDTKSKDKDKE